MKKMFALGAVLALLAIAPAMKASTITYTLTQDGCTGTCGTGPFGTIQLTDNGSGNSATVSVLLTLTGSENFAGTGAGEALAFNVNKAVTINVATSGFSAGVGGTSASVFGNFTNFVHCDSPPCQGGNGPAGPLSFTVGSATGVTIANFIANSGGFFFASDIMGSNGKTGNVAAIGTTTTTPEPISSALVGGGLLSLFLLRRRARK